MPYPPTRNECKQLILKSKVYRGIHLTGLLLAFFMLAVAVVLCFSPPNSVPNQSGIITISIISGVCSWLICWNEIKVSAKNINWAEAHLVKGCRD